LSFITKHLLKIALVITLLVALIFCIRQIGEPDVWWQIRTGQYIVEHGEVPKVDVFSYTYDGDPWINVKWLTEVMMAGFSDLMGPEFLMLQQAIALLLICWLLLVAAKNYSKIAGDEKDIFQPGALLAMLFVLMGMSFRINGRPEMVSHVFTCLYLYLMTDYRVKPGKKVFLFIPAMLLWANMHEAFGVGVVLLVLFNVLSWLEYFIQKNQAYRFEQHDLLKLSGVSLIAILATAIHPSGTKMLTHPFEIYGQLGDNKFTTELFGFQSAEYWNLGSFIALIFFIACVIFIFGKFKQGKELMQKAGFALVVIFAALTYLSLQAYRNVPFFLFASFPLVALFLAKRLKAKALQWATIGLGALIYISVGSGWFYEKFLPMEKYGLRVDPTRNPIGASEFIKEHDVGGNGFVDYLSSAYMLWDLAPEYKSYLDLRDLDVFEGQFIDNILASYVYPARKLQGGKGLFQTLDEHDNFNYVVMVNKKEFSPILRYLNKSKKYELVYADLSTSVFLKKNDANEALINEFGEGNIESKFHAPRALETPGLAYAVSKVFWPFYVETDYEQLNYESEKGVLRQMMGK